MRWSAAWVLAVAPNVLTAQRTRAASDTAQATAVAPSIVGSATLTGREEIAVRSQISPRRVYVGQQATYEVGVFLSDAARARMRRNPEFVPPELRSMLAFDLAVGTPVPSRMVNGTRYEVHVFRRALFPLAAGALDIPPARLNYALPLSSSFFSREESHTERTDAQTLVAVAPPASGRPAGFRGAVGRLAISARMDNRRGRVGDPLLVTVTVSGLANVALLPRPRVEVPWGDAVSGGERMQVDTSGPLVSGRKEFDFLITPRRSGALAMPAIVYEYFDPYSERYVSALTTSLDVVVDPGGTAPAPGDVADSVSFLPLRRVYRGDLPPPLPGSRWYWLAVALTPLPALFLSARRRPKRTRVETPSTRIQHMASRGIAEPSALRRDFILAVIDRIPGTETMFSNHARLSRALRRAGVSPGVAADTSLLLAELDGAVFGNAPEHIAGDVPARAQKLLAAIDAEALSRDDLRHGVGRIATALLIGALGLAGAGGLVAAVADPFDDAVRAYDDRELSKSKAIFEQVAITHPRAADAWANLGSVAWQLGDTVTAAVGWQRALRLEPLADDVRSYLELTPSFDSGPLGDVPPVPLTGLAVFGAAAWIIGWYTPALGRPAKIRRLTGQVLLGTAGLALFCGLALDDIVTGRHAAVVAVSTRLRTTPALTAESGPEVLPGELARTTGEQTAWTRVRLRDGRVGWIETRFLRSLRSS